MNDLVNGTESYSYQGQDLFVLETLGGLTGGYFLDSGASNGLKGSNTLLLESAYGWTGICVEPNEENFRQLRANRACLCLDCCLYDEERSVDFLEVAGVYGGILDEYDRRHLGFVRRVLGERWPEGAPPPVVSKRARTIRSVLSDARAPSTIDYWSLDTEGSEMALLRSFPFDAYKVRLLTVEHNNGPIRDEIRSFLEARGYVRVADLGIDDGYLLMAVSARPDWSRTPTAAWRSTAWRRRSGRRR